VKRITADWQLADGSVHARRAAAVVGVGLAAACMAGRAPRPPAPGSEPIVPGITVLLEDSVGLVQGKRVGLLTNQTGVDRSGASDIELLAHSPRATRAGVRLAAIFSPEHGLRGAEDRQYVDGGIDPVSGVRVYSLYGATVVAPPDSVLRQLDVLVVDLQDVGTRTWTYVASMVYAMRAAARNRLPVIVLDRPNPLTGRHAEGPVLDSALADADEGAAGRPARPYALSPIPLRHALTMGELALYFNDALALHADLHVMPVRGWHRAQWLDQTGLPWVRPSPNLPSMTSALLYPALVAFEGSNLSVGRGSADAFQRLGAPWLDARRVVALLASRGLAGVRFEADTFTPEAPTDGKYAGRRLPSVRIVVMDREQVQAARVGAALLWAVSRINGDSLRLDTTAFDLRFGSGALRAALIRGDDPDRVIDGTLPAVASFEARAQRYTMYR
jgi:uncharacterized protein YbbC (DUF1343 family)